MLGGAGGACSPGGESLLTVIVARDDQGYGMKVSGDNPVYVQSVKEHGAAWKAGLRAGDRILRVDSMPVHHHTHQQVVALIRANPSPTLTVQQNSSRHKTPITAPVPVDPEKQRQLEAAKAHTFRLMLDKEQKYIRELRNELLKVPDMRKQTELEAAEQRCSNLQLRIDDIRAAQPEVPQAPPTPKMARKDEKAAQQNPTSFLSGLPRSLSNLTGQSLRNLRQARQKQENTPPLVRQNSDESNNKRRHGHNNTVPMVPTTCLDNTPPPLPPRSIERPKRSPLSPNSPMGMHKPGTPLTPPNPMGIPKPGTSQKYYKGSYMHQGGLQPVQPRQDKFRRSSHSLDGELEGPQPNSIAMQMIYPLVNVPPPPLQTDNHSGLPILHVRSQSSPEHPDHELTRPMGERPPGTPPPPYPQQPCADPQRAIISMEEDDSPASDNSTCSGLFSNLHSVRESKARMAVLINWLLGERRCACASLLLVLTDAYRAAAGVQLHTLRRWAYEIQSTFLMPNAVLQLSGVDETMANEIDNVLRNEHDKEELLRNVFRKARRQAKEELARQLSEFQVKRQVGLATLYGPGDHVLQRCDCDRQQELIVVERLMSARLSTLTASPPAGPSPSADVSAALLAALTAAALCLGCRPASVAAAAGGARASFLQRDKLYKQRVKQLAKQHPQPFVVRGHHLQLQALTAVHYCHHCGALVSGLAPQAYVCGDCDLRVHRTCARHVEESCVLDHADQPQNRISRLMERIHPQPGLDSGDKKSRKSSSAHFLNMERSFRKSEEICEQPASPLAQGEQKREGSTEEPTADADAEPRGDPAPRDPPDKEHDKNWKGVSRGVNRAESCRERDVPRRGKHRNASDPNRLTAHPNHDLEPGAPTAPSGSSSSSSLSSRSNESATVPPYQQGSQSDWSEEEEPLAAQWSDSLPAAVRDSVVLSARLRKRQEVMHELIVSEGSHVRWLKVLGVEFLKPLERQPALLPSEDLRALFPNLPSVRERHSRLYAELRAARNDAPQHVVQIGPVAEALLNTLGESGYAACLSRFCRGQRMALDALRERRRKSKELHQFLCGREQLPRCGRLQLRDLLACVWQRLTKYQLLLESILKTVCEGAEGGEGVEEGETDSAEEAAQLRRALAVAKEVLHSVDTAIRTAENEHRLKTIQSKLDVRVNTLDKAEADELRRLDLTQHALRYEGELLQRIDSKKCSVLALLLDDCLVLLQREGDRFVLRPVVAPSAHWPLLPVIKWDKVLFRPNAAVRNTFLLININGIQMHELSANTPAEYATWVKHIKESPLARLAENKPVLPHPPTDHRGTNVSRNPSDASEKSAASDRSADGEGDNREDGDKEEARQKEDEEESEKGALEKRASSDREGVESSVGCISTHEVLSPPPLEPLDAVSVTPPGAVRTATRVQSPAVRLQLLDRALRRALSAKSAVAAEMLGVPMDSFDQLGEMATAETMQQIGAGRAARGAPDLHQLLLVAQAQANQLTELVSSALSVSDAAAVAARAGRCDRCRHERERPSPAYNDVTAQSDEMETSAADARRPGPADAALSSYLEEFPKLPASEPTPDITNQSAKSELEAGGRDAGDSSRRSFKPDEFDNSYLEEFPKLPTSEAPEEWCERGIAGVGDRGGEMRGETWGEGSAAAGAALLAVRLAGTASALQAALGELLSALPALEAERAALRRELGVARERADRDYHLTNEMLARGNADQSIQEQPSHGG